MELVCALDRLDGEIGPRRIADEERITGENEPGLFGSAAVDHDEAAVLWTVAGRVEHPQHDVSEHDLAAVFEWLVVVRSLRGRVDPDWDPVLEREPAVSRDMI